MRGFSRVSTIFFIILFFIFQNCIHIFGATIDIQKTKIWGPGLEPHKIVLPVRHFYVQLIDLEGYPLNPSYPTKLNVNIYGKSAVGKCRTRIEVIDRLDLVIVRYKVFGSCWNFEIHIKYDQKHLAGSPYLISGNVYSEKCFCPQKIEKWLENNKCEGSYEQINADLRPFNRVNFRKMQAKIVEKFSTKTSSVSLCHYVIKNNQFFRKCYGQYTGFKMFIDSLFSTLINIVELPDMEVMVNLGDWPLVSNNIVEPLSIFSWCGSVTTLDIVMPTYELTESSLEAMSRISVDVLSVQKSKLTWNEKHNVLFWRGRDSRRERLNLIDIARKNPDLFNVSLTNFFFFRDEENKYGPKSPHLPFFEFFDYKYQLNIDGTVAAYRFPYLLAGNSLVFKQDSPFYEHFYSQLQEDFHYIPIKRDLSNLVEKLAWARENDDIALKIAQHSQQFVNDYLTPDKILCYQVTLLKEWSLRLVDPVDVQEDMKKFAKDENECECTGTAPHRNEL